MKLNYKRTFFVGFAFFLICVFWQAYDNIIPKILIDKFGMSQTWSGFVMALDNILALVLLPLFGILSDRCRSKYGRRTPFIIVGTLCAAICFIGLSFVDNVQIGLLGDAAEFEKTEDGVYVIPEEGMKLVLNSVRGKILTTSDGREFSVGEAPGSPLVITEEEFMSIRGDDPAFVDYVVAARQCYASEVTLRNRGIFVIFIFVLFLVLVSMAIFRSPAVALMPDVTVKPLRSQANAIINLMGSAGGILVLVLGMVFSTGAYYNAMISYTGYFILIVSIMLLALVLFLLKVKEPQFVREMHEDSRLYGLEEAEDGADAGEATVEKRKLGRAEKKSLIFIMLSIVLWFMGYNAVTSKYSVYAGSVLNLDYNLTLIIAQVAAIVSYFPVAVVASRLGRKKSIMTGVLMLAVAFGVASFLRAGSSPLLMNAMFALAGTAWATISVNSFPMVVELAKDSDVGKFTGFYYTASMAAQTVTPLLSGLLMDKTGKMTVLFPYAAGCVILAFFTMCFVRHGDSKPPVKQVVTEALSGDS